MRQWDEQPEEYVCSIADALRSGDEVILNGRSRALTVLGRDEQPNPGVVKSTFYPARIVWLRGNGTEYRLRYSHSGEYWPRINTESELETEESYSIRHGEPKLQTRATEPGSYVRRILVEGVDEDDLSEWALTRNLRGLEEFAEDAEGRTAGGRSE